LLKSQSLEAFMRAILAVLAAVCVAGFVAASSTAADENKHEPAVTMTNDMAFAPAKLKIPVGTTVHWQNRSHDTHTVTFDPKRAKDPKDVELPEGAKPFDSGDVKPGDSYSHTFDVPGTYKYVCVPHEKMGMKGEIEVTPKK
jgi:plastocyanin